MLENKVRLHPDFIFTVSLIEKIRYSMLEKSVKDEDGIEKFFDNISHIITVDLSDCIELQKSIDESYMDCFVGIGDKKWGIEDYNTYLATIDGYMTRETNKISLNILKVYEGIREKAVELSEYKEIYRGMTVGNFLSILPYRLFAFQSLHLCCWATGQHPCSPEEARSSEEQPTAQGRSHGHLEVHLSTHWKCKVCDAVLHFTARLGDELIDEKDGLLQPIKAGILLIPLKMLSHKKYCFFYLCPTNKKSHASLFSNQVNSLCIIMYSVFKINIRYSSACYGLLRVHPTKLNITNKA